jgi:hypothetical protein
VRPLGDDLVGLGEPGRGGEHRPGVADRDPVTEELARPGHRGGEVDRPEHQHPRRRGEGLHEHAEVVQAPFTVRAVPADPGDALRQHAPGVVVHGLVQPVARAERALGRGRLPAGGPDDPARADPARAVDHGGDRDRLVGLYRGGDLGQFGEPLLVDRLDENVDDPAAGQADGEGVVVADPVALKDRLAASHDRRGQLVGRALDAAAGHAADDLAPGGHGERGARLAGRAAERAHHRGQADGLTGGPPLEDRLQDVSHCGHLGT